MLINAITLFFSMTVRHIVVLVVLCDIHGNIWCYEFHEIFFTDNGKYFSKYYNTSIRGSSHYLYSTFRGLHLKRRILSYRFNGYTIAVKIEEFLLLTYVSECLTNQSMGRTYKYGPSQRSILIYMHV